ncbi:AAA family ATPase [Sulfurimonas aquatica]|uniref:AAA family ATPase n=1 Tax=Sulfurimonas aquatica TaxID=2672570 RepID=A0A975B0N0_9BACT|nr:AAA family ATPase [Sulfurimonas aquatica]QSZ41955.1 AAA family ATPase [Sulfurimonas aquatica]
MIIAYVSNRDQECYTELKDEFEAVHSLNSIDDFINFYARSKNRDIVLIYRVEQLSDIEQLADLHFSNNIYMIVVGKDDIEYSLLAGKIGVDAYLNEEQSNPNSVKELIFKSQSIIKKRRGKSNISVFTGISGGVGTTTITMNIAKNIAENYPDKNVLFLDFAYTKSVSNLFFEHVQPNKTIIDIAMLQNLEMEDLFDNGLERYSNNFYFVPGIQKHTDREDLEKPENIQRFLNFINFIKDKFDFILIDVGMFEDVELEIDIQELADSIYVVTEFSIPSMSILKTYIDIIDKSGWYSKTHIIANRSDSFGTVTEEEAKKILSKGLKHQFEVHYSLPNDAMHLRECWNEAKLVHDVYPTSPFMLGIEDMITKFFIHDSALHVNNIHKITKSNSIMEKIKKWL